MKSKHTPEEYIKWIKNFVLLNKSIVFFSNKKFMPTLKEMRPIELHKKSVFIEIEMEDFYSYKNFFDNFTELYKDDFEKNIHNVPLYLIWAEKGNFLKKAIAQDYFKSKCFYWIDIGYFSVENINYTNYLNGWPKLDQCLGDEKIIIGTVRNYTESEKENFVKFDPGEHYRFPRTINIAGIIGLKESIKYLTNIGMDNISDYEMKLRKYLIDKLIKIKHIDILNIEGDSGIVSFNVDGIFAQDVAYYLNKHHICVRAGSHCAKNLKFVTHKNSSVRISMYFYNTYEDIDKLVDLLKDKDRILEEMI